MASWRKISTDKEPISDEVPCCSGSDSTYEVTPAAVFEVENEVKELVTIRAKAYSTCLCISFDYTVFYFESTLQQVLFSKVFDSIIDGFSVIENESLLGVGLRNGCVHCFSIQEDKKIFQWQVEAVAGESTFVELLPGEGQSFILVGQGGKIYRATIPQLTVSSPRLSDDTKLECLLDFKCEVFSSCLHWNLDGSHSVFLGGTSQLYRYSNHMLHSKAICSIDNNKRVEKVLSNSDNSLILCLVEEKLLFYCCLTFLCLKVFDGRRIKDFALVANAKEEEQLLVVVVDEKGKNFLELLNISDLACQLKLEVKHAVLFDSSFLMENFVFLDGASLNNTSDHLINSVALKSIAESIPMDRLNRLLRKHLFKEADEFASQHGLDTQYIHKMQFRQCIESIENNSSIDESIDYSHLASLIGKIEDIKFVADLIFSMSCLNLSFMKKLLSVCLEKLELNSGKDDVELGEISKCISECLLLLDTFSILWPNDAEQWPLFAKTSILETFQRSMGNEEWFQAWVIWERHWEQCLQQFNSIEEVIEMFEKLPLDAFSQEVYAILKTTVPKFTSYFTDAADFIVKWVIGRIKYYETRENWADIALVFVENLLSYLGYSAKFGENDIIFANTLLHSGQESNWDSMHVLLLVIEALKDIKYFKSEFGIEIKLSDYDQERKENLVYVLLGKIHNVHDYEKLIPGFIMKYIVKYKLNFDDVIEDFIKELFSSPYWSTDFDVNVSKAVALAGYIKDTETKGRCILELMKTAHLPWDENLSQLVSAGMLLNHPIAESITLQLNLLNSLVTLKKYNLDSCHVIQDFQMIITHIIKVGGDQMLQDCLSLASSEAKREEVYAMCSEHYIKQRDYAKAFTLWNSLPKNLCIGVLQRIVHYIHAASLIQGFENTDVTYINNLKLIEMHLHEVLKDLDEGEYILEEIPVKKLKGDYFTKKCMDSTSEMDDVKPNASMVNKSLSKFADWSYADTSMRDLSLQVKKLSEILGCGVEQILIDRLNKTDEEDEALSTALIMQLLVSVSKAETESDIFGWILSSLMKSSLRKVCGRNIQKLLWKNLAVCNPRDLPICLEICQYLGQWLLDHGSPGMHISHIASFFLPKSWGMMRISQEDMQLPPVTLLQGAVMREKHRQYWFALLSQVHTTEESSLDTMISSSTFKSACKYQQDASAWLSFEEDCITAWNLALWSDSKDIKLNSSNALPSKLTSHKEFDIILMVGLLLCFDMPPVLKWLDYSISRCKGDLSKMQLYVSMGEILCELYQISEGTEMYANMHLNCIVDKRLQEMGMTVDCKVGGSADIPKDVILKRILNHRNITALDLEELCFLCGLDIEAIFLKYLEHKLLSWTPKYSLKKLLNGQEEIVILNSVDEISKAFSLVIPSIKTEVLSKFLHDVWGKVNYYHYEIYEKILDVLVSINSDPQFVIKQKNMIRFLKTYNRTSSPTSAEMSIFDEILSLPEIAQWRLPLLTNDYKHVEEALPSQITSISVASSIIDAEVTFHNYSKWLKAPPIDGHDTRTICSLAIKHGIKVYLKGCNDNSEWQLYPSKENFLRCVKECVAQMLNPKYATAAIKYTTAKLPQGVDQLLAMQLCLSLAKEWVKTGRDVEEARKLLEKVESRYLSLSVKHILYLHGFGMPKYLEMISQPEDLISSLYYDATNFESSILAGKDGGVNEVGEEIARLFSVDLKRLKLQLISKWISPKEDKIALLDISCIGEIFATEGRLNSVAFDEELRRLLHICKSMEKKVVIDHFMSLASPTFPLSARLKVTLCLRELDEKYAATVFSTKGITDFGTYVKKLYFLLQLEGLGIVHSLEEFESLDSRTLVTTILYKKPHQMITVPLAAKLCLSSCIFDHSLWSEILNMMIKLSMSQALADILPLLRIHSSFIGVQAYQNAWKEVLEVPFCDVTDQNSLTYEEEQKCMTSLQLFHLCPFLVDVDVNGIAAKCLKIGKLEMAALLLPFLPPTSRIKLKQELTSCGPVNDLMGRMQSLPHTLQVYSHQVLTILTNHCP